MSQILYLTSEVSQKLDYLCELASPKEVSAMGILEVWDSKPVIVDFYIPKQEATAGSVDLDMESVSDHVATLFTEKGIQPWQHGVWIHTHPRGMNHPSTTDTDTMKEDFGERTTFMAILTQDGQWFCQLWANSDLGDLHQKYTVDFQVETLTSGLDAEAKASLKASYDDKVSSPIITTPRVWTGHRGANGQFLGEGEGEGEAYMSEGGVNYAPTNITLAEAKIVAETTLVPARVAAMMNTHLRMKWAQNNDYDVESYPFWSNWMNGLATGPRQNLQGDLEDFMGVFSINDPSYARILIAIAAASACQVSGRKNKGLLQIPTKEIHQV